MLKDIFSGIVSAVTGNVGGVASSIVNTVSAYFPPSMSDKEKAELALIIGQAEHQRELSVINAVNKAQLDFQEFTKEMEGTAGDLKTIPLLGNIIIFIRGAQRPIWGIFVLFADYQVFSKMWELDPQQTSILFALNILVLTFLFGERAVKNLMPFFEKFFGVNHK